MKIRISTILMALVVIAGILNFNCFYLGYGPASTSVFWIVMLCLFICLLLCRSGLSDMKDRMPFAFYYGFVVIVCFLLVFAYTLSAFPEQGFRSTMYSGYSLLIILLIYPLGYFLVCREDPAPILGYMNAMAFVWYVLVLLQKVLYEAAGTIILTDYFPDGEVALRNGNIRISLLIYGNIMLVYNFYRLYTGKARNRKFTILMVILGCFELVAIQQTRMYIIVVFTCILLIVLLDKNTESGLLRKLLILCLVAVLLLQTGSVITLIQSFSETGELGGSTTARLGAIAYYWSYWLKHPLFGMGFASDGYYYSLLHGSEGIYYMSDVGFIGQLARLGVFIIPLYVVPVFRMCQITYRLWNKNAEDWLLYFAFLVYILGTSISLIILSSKLIMAFPILIVLFEYKYDMEKERVPEYSP